MKDKKMKKLRLVSIMLVVIIGSCDGQKSPNKRSISKNCISLNDEAYSHLDKYSFGRGDIKEADTALLLFKQAIKCDSTYVIAYKNLADTYGIMKNYNAEMVIIDKLISVSGNNPIFIIHKGVLYQAKNKPDSAAIAFSKADSIYDSKLAQHPENIHIMLDKIMLKSISMGKVAAKKELGEQIKKHPKDSIELVKKTNYLEDND